MKRVLILLGLGVLWANVAAAGPGKQNGPGLASSSGADLVRGAWSGTLSFADGPKCQMNLCFTAAAYTGASGYLSLDAVGGPKRAKAPALPMMARVMKTEAGDFDVVILATVQMPSGPGSATVVVRLAGTAVLGSSSLTDDVMQGTWSLMGSDGMGPHGTWSVKHLDRRSVKGPIVDLSDPTLQFDADVYAGLEGPLGQQEPATCLGVISNIAASQVRVTLPNGAAVVIDQYTDVFSPWVDGETAFRYVQWLPGLPVAGGRYIFTALDAGGNPIPNVETSDVWVGVKPPKPPTGVQVSEVDEGIVVGWRGGPEVPGSFEPLSNIGYYQLELSGPLGMVYGASGIGAPPHLIPRDSSDFVPGVDWGFSLNELEGGWYSLRTSVVSLAPADSAGYGIEYHNADESQTKWVEIAGGLIVVGS